MTLDPFTTPTDITRRVTKAIGPGTDTPTTNSTPAHSWTPAELRGIPAVGKGCGTGAIGETEPGWNLDHWPNPTPA